MGTTATQKLTYPDSGDQLNQQAQFLETLAKQVDARASANAAVLASQLNRPFAIIDCTIPNSISATDSSSLPLFDSVVVDTAGLVDLSLDRRYINLPTPGYWLLGAYVDFVGSPGGSNCATIGAINCALNCDNSVANRWTGYVKDVNTGHSYVCTSGMAQILSTALPGRVYLSASLAAGTTCTNVFTVSTARMWAFKVREL